MSTERKLSLGETLVLAEAVAEVLRATRGPYELRIIKGIQAGLDRLEQSAPEERALPAAFESVEGHDPRKLVFLTPMRYRIVLGVAQRRGSQEIASKFSIPYDSVRTQLSRIYKLVGVRGIEELYELIYRNEHFFTERDLRGGARK